MAAFAPFFAAGQRSAHFPVSTINNKGEPSVTALRPKLFFAVLAGFALHPASGQEAMDGLTAFDATADGVHTSEDGTTITYDARFFVPYQPVTAADMLRWVPGGAALLPEDRNNNFQQEKRGFGSGGDQILINGKRISGKSNDIRSAIQRIQASVVERIELIRGNSAGLDVRSEGTLLNIVLAEDISGGSGTWQLHSGFYNDSPEYDALVSYSDAIGDLNYLVSAEYGPYNRGEYQDRVERYFAAGTGELIETRDIERPELKEALILNTSASRESGGGSILNMNARVEDAEQTTVESTLVTPAGGGAATTLENISAEDEFAWELGGDYETRLGNGVLKTRAIYSDRTEDESESISLSSSAAGNVPLESRVLSDSSLTESIIRSSYGWPIAATQNLELGIEGAVNTLEKDVRLFEVLADGSLVPVGLFNAESDIEENRYEFFSTHFWQARDNVTLESALNFEYSKIEQTGADIANARSFTYLKPRFDLRWNLDDANRLRASLERTVSQLDFSDFVLSYDSENDVLDAGNPNLEPEKAWEWKFSYERRLKDDAGVLEAELFYSQVEDHIDKIEIRDLTTGSGNIGDAEFYGIWLRSSVRLTPLGLEGAVVDADYRYQQSETTDAFTGRKRDMIRKPHHRYSIKFRHDIPEWNFNYAVNVEWFGERVNTDVLYSEINDSLNPQVNLTAQYRLTNSMFLWLDVRYAIDEHHRRIRERYVGNIADGVLLRTEVRDQYRRTSFIFGLRGQF